MNKEQIEVLLKKMAQIISCINGDKMQEAYRETALTLPAMQQFVMGLLECEILEQQVALTLMTNLVEAIEQRDDVLLLDTLAYGLNTLTQDILRIMEEDIDE